MNAPRYIARAANVAFRAIGDETMIMSGRDSSLFSLNETASLLWHAADGSTPLAEIVEQQICSSFDVDLVVAIRDAEALADDLARQGILFVSDSPIANAPSAEAR